MKLFSGLSSYCGDFFSIQNNFSNGFIRSMDGRTGLVRSVVSDRPPLFWYNWKTFEVIIFLSTVQGYMSPLGE